MKQEDARKPTHRRGLKVKKILRVLAPVLVLVAGVAIVQVLVAAKPEPEKNEDEARLVSLYVDEVTEEVVTVSVRTQGEVRPKTEIALIPQAVSYTHLTLPTIQL